MSDQTIFRVHREQRDKWTNVLTGTIRDQRLSFKATGLLVYLLSLPDDWKVSIAHISEQKRDGRDAVLSAFDELKKCGYVSNEIARNNGTITGSIWHVYETPQSGFPNTGKPHTGIPHTENPPLRKNEATKEPETNTGAPANGSTYRGVARMPDDEFVATLQANEAYKHINVKNELAKAATWCSVNNRVCNRKFFINWINRTANDTRAIKTTSKHSTNPRVVHSINQPGRYDIGHGTHGGGKGAQVSNQLSNTGQKPD